MLDGVAVMASKRCVFHCAHCRIIQAVSKLEVGMTIHYNLDDERVIAHFRPSRFGKDFMEYVCLDQRD